MNGFYHRIRHTGTNLEDLVKDGEETNLKPWMFDAFNAEWQLASQPCEVCEFWSRDDIKVATIA